MALLGKLLRRFRAGAERSPLAGPAFTGAAAPIALTSPAFADGAEFPEKFCGKKIGPNVSPPLAWADLPGGTGQLVLVLEDLDTPGPKPLLHTLAVLDPGLPALAEGALAADGDGVRLVKAFGAAYVGPSPIAGHGVHHYRFTVLAVDAAVPSDAVTADAVLAAAAGHVLARGELTGTRER